MVTHGCSSDISHDRCTDARESHPEAEPRKPMKVDDIHVRELWIRPEET